QRREAQRRLGGPFHRAGAANDALEQRRDDPGHADAEENEAQQQQDLPRPLTDAVAGDERDQPGENQAEERGDEYPVGFAPARDPPEDAPHFRRQAFGPHGQRAVEEVERGKENREADGEPDSGAAAEPEGPR